MTFSAVVVIILVSVTISPLVTYVIERLIWAFRGKDASSTTFDLELNKAAEEVLDSTSKMAGITESEVLRRGLIYMAFIEEQRAKGKRLFVVDKDGKEIEVVFT